MQAQPALRLHHIGFLAGDFDRAAEHLRANFGYQIESPIIEAAEGARSLAERRLNGEALHV
jgi:hypothetical protein